MVLQSKVVVLNDQVKMLYKQYQVCVKKLNENEPLMKCRKGSSYPFPATSPDPRRGRCVILATIHYFYNMPAHHSIPYDHGVFSITFTCAGWLLPIEMVNSFPATCPARHVA
jgi:hypothetical protein